MPRDPEILPSFGISQAEGEQDSVRSIVERSLQFKHARRFCSAWLRKPSDILGPSVPSMGWQAIGAHGSDQKRSYNGHSHGGVPGPSRSKPVHLCSSHDVAGSPVVTQTVERFRIPGSLLYL